MSDIGKLVGRYFQTLAGLSIILMVISAVFFNQLVFDVSWVFLLWAGHFLIKHNPAARLWTIRVLGLFLAGLLAISAAVAVVGTEGMTLTVGHIVRENPPFYEIALIAGVLLILIIAPFVLLLTATARREFQAGQ